MFQTEINLFFQSFASDFLTAIFRFFTEFGTGNMTVAFVVVIMFGVHFRNGLLITHIIFWNGIITDFLKETFSLPRPANVDSHIQLLGKDYPNPTQFKGMGGQSFFDCLPGHVVDSLRQNPIDSWGLPSGHTSNAVALWGSIVLLFKKTWVKVVALIFILFVPLSRIYLGRHFLADVLAGFLLGFFMLYLFYRLVFTNEKLKAWVFEGFEKIGSKTKLFAFLGYLLGGPLLLILLPKIKAEAAPALLGLNCGFLLVWLRGLPREAGVWWQRMARVSVAGGLYFGVKYILAQVLGAIFQEIPPIAFFFSVSVTTFCLIWGATELNIKLGLFNR